MLGVVAACRNDDPAAFAPPRLPAMASLRHIAGSLYCFPVGDELVSEERNHGDRFVMEIDFLLSRPRWIFYEYSFFFLFEGIMSFKYFFEG